MWQRTQNQPEMGQSHILWHLNSVIITDEQAADIISFCEIVKVGLDLTTFEDKRSLIELPDVRGTLAVEDGQKVVYVKCLHEQQRLVQMRTSHSQYVHCQHSIELTARLVLAANLSLGDKRLSNYPDKQRIPLEKRGKSDKT